MRFVIENHRYLMTMIPVLTLFFFTGCGPKYDEDQILDPLKLVQKFDANTSNRDTEEFVEINLNPFLYSTQIQESASGATIAISFQLYIVVPKTSEETMKEKISDRRNRLIEGVKKIVRQSNMRELSDPDFVLLKSKLVEALRRDLSDEVHDVVFAEFSINSN